MITAMRLSSLFLLFYFPCALLYASEKIYLNDYQTIFNTSLACSSLSKNQYSLQITNCLINTNNILKNNIKESIQMLKPRDQIYYLNTKGVDFELQRYSCINSFYEKNTQLQCEIYSNLSLLNFIKDRYLTK